MPGSWHVMLFILIFNLWLSQVAGTPHNANLKAIENGYGICVYIYIYIENCITEDDVIQISETTTIWFGPSLSAILRNRFISPGTAFCSFIYHVRHGCWLLNWVF